MSSRQISRRQMLKTAADALGGAALAACGSAPATTETPAAPTAAPAAAATSAPAAAAATTAPAAATVAPAAAVGGSGEAANLVFLVDTINEAHVKLRDEWVKTFQEANPNITVEHQVVPQDFNVKFQTLFAAGTPPDVFRYWPENTPIVTAVEKKFNLKLDDLVAKDNYDVSDFRPTALELYQWEGGLYGLPRDYGNQNLFYNEDLLAKAGVEPPPSDWTESGFTFDKFLELAQKLTVKEGDRTTQWGFLVNRGWRPWASWVYNNGGTVVKKDDSGLATEISLTDPQSVEALQFLQDLMYKHQVSPKPDIEAETTGVELFGSGRVAMMINNPSSVSQYRTIEAFKWNVATLPIGRASKRGTGGGGTGWAAGAPTKFPEAAWKFVAYIASEEAELGEVRIGATTPSRMSVANSEAFIDPTKPPTNAKAFVQAQEYVVRDPVAVRWPEVMQRVITTNMDQLWSGSQTAQQVADAIKAAGDPLLKG